MKSARSDYARKLLEFEDIVSVDEAAFQHRGNWGDFFEARIGPSFDGRVIFEIGCFDADYLSRLAAKHPRTAFIGLDWKCKAIYEGACRIAKLELRNIVLLRGRAQDVASLFAKGEVAETWVFHPDPCDRPIELKNRLIAEPFLIDLHGVLQERHAALFLKTDHPGYYQWVLGLFGLPEPAWFRTPGDLPTPRVRSRDLMRIADIPPVNEAILQRFQVSANSVDFWNDPLTLAATADRYFADEVTLFENRFIRQRLPIYFMQIDKVMK